MPLPAEFEKKLWAAADQLWTNSALQPAEYSTPVLALIFLKYADHRFAQAEKALAGKARRRGAIGKDDYHGQGVLYVPEEARFRKLVELPEGADIGRAINEAMKAIEGENDELKDVLPKAYGRFGAQTLKELLKLFGTIPEDVEGDVFGRIYEYFLGNFAPQTLQKGGEYFTPYSVVRLIVEIVEPYHGRIYDPCCGSGGMFVQSAGFIAAHEKKASDELSVFGVEKVEQTRRLARMNLAVHGLSGDIKEANSYYENIHDQVGKFDFVMANPPFNQNAVDRERIKDDKKRFPLGMPSTDNANYLWIQLFYSALNEKGRAGFVMANSASDARGSELELRKKLIQSGAVDVMVTLSSNFFYTVTLPVTLWFLDKGKTKGKRKDEVLFIDARHIFRQVDRAHRDFSDDQREYLANIVRLWRGEPVENRYGGGKVLKDSFPSGKYEDLAGLCKVATLKEIEAQGWSLNPGRYVGVAERAAEEFDFKERREDLDRLNGDSRKLEGRIAVNVVALLEERVRQRRDFLDEMDALIANDATPETALHSAIERNLWLLGSDYVALASNRTLASMVEKCFGGTFRGRRARKRPDLLLARSGGVRYLLIEFKRPGHSVTRDDENQAIKYRDDLSPFTNGLIDVLIIGGARCASISPRYATDGVRVMTYFEMLSNARANFDWLFGCLGLSLP